MMVYSVKLLTDRMYFAQRCPQMPGINKRMTDTYGDLGHLAWASVRFISCSHSERLRRRRKKIVTCPALMKNGLGINPVWKKFRIRGFLVLFPNTGNTAGSHSLYGKGSSTWSEIMLTSVWSSTLTRQGNSFCGLIQQRRKHVLDWLFDWPSRLPWRSPIGEGRRHARGRTWRNQSTES